MNTNPMWICRKITSPQLYSRNQNYFISLETLLIWETRGYNTKYITPNLLTFCFQFIFHHECILSTVFSLLENQLVCDILVIYENIFGLLMLKYPHIWHCFFFVFFSILSLVFLFSEFSLIFPHWPQCFFRICFVLLISFS